uniref:M-phase phosphoprotein 6 n=1 Tax=Panagrellus redivivus TaxID=6233 RepID=A0A7E4UX85_PANRE
MSRKVGNAEVVKISEDLLQMQFMRSTKLKLEERAKKEDLAQLEKDYAGKTIPAAHTHDRQSKFVFCPDIGLSELQNVKYGRFSFNGANPEIEKIMTDESIARRRRNDPNWEDDESIFKDIPDYEMAESVFSRAKYIREGMVQPSAEAVNIYTEESTSAEPAEGDSESTDQAAIAARANAMLSKKRFNPYDRNSRGRGRGRGRK